MFGYPNNIEAVKAKARIEYGVELAPFDTERQRIMTWIKGWQTAPTLADKRMWVHECMGIAVRALISGMLSPEEYPPVLHEVLILGTEGDKYISPEDRSAWETACARWMYKFTPGCSCAWCTAPPTGLLTPENSPGPVFTAPELCTSPPEKPKKKRGRPPGAKDVEKRASRGSIAHLDGSQRSHRNRNGPTARQRRQQQQQQQQSAPA